MSKKVIAIGLSRQESENTSLVDSLYEERQVLLTELIDIKRVLAMVLSVNGPTQLPNALMVSFDFEHTDIVEERVEAGVRYSLDQWTPRT